MSKYLKQVLDAPVPQSEALPGQVANSAGGFAYPVDDWVRLERFLILGTEGGSYYATQRALTLDNAQAVLRCIKADGPRTVSTILGISHAGRAPKNDPALFALAMSMVHGNDSTKQAAHNALPFVARIGTHIFQFAGYLQSMGGWGRAKRQAVAAWYSGMENSKLAYQAIKYRQRDGWSHADLLRLSHPKIATSDVARRTILDWMCNGWEGVGEDVHPDEILRIIWAHERAQVLGTIDASYTSRAVRGLILEHNLPRESIPTKFLNEPLIWDALLENMPMTAMVRNLAKMTSIGLIGMNSRAARLVQERLRNEGRIKAARVHPIALLGALKVYEQGHGERGNLTWTPVPSVLDALNDAFYLSFGNVPVTNKRWDLGCDISGSMTMGTIAGMPGVTPRVATAALACVTAATEPQYIIKGFSTSLVDLGISPRMRLDEVMRIMGRVPFGGTDCSLPILDATKNKIPVDVFVVLTDSETWAGNIHPSVALAEYRQKMGIPAKMVTVGMLANAFSIADPDDAGMMDVVGMDTATPSLMADFATGGQTGEVSASTLTTE